MQEVWIALLEANESIYQFMDAGGPILDWIAVLVLVMWFMILERVLFLTIFIRRPLGQALRIWHRRKDHKSWRAKQIRDMVVAQLHQSIRKSLPLIKTCVAICPLLGLLGTVTGMIEVFHVMAISGGGDAKQMAAGVSRATLPTLAGMVAALSGLGATVWLDKRVAKQSLHVQEVFGRD